MVWTYLGFPTDNQKDEVRFLVGDTDSSNQQLSDEEIYYLLGVFPNPLAAAAMGADTLASKYAKDAVDKEVGDLKLKLTGQAQNFRDQASRLWSLSKVRRLSPAIYAGGISKADKQAQVNDADRVDPYFYRGMTDYEGTEIGSSS